MGRPSTPILQRKLVVDEALAMIDEVGLPGFSMPGLAKRLGVRTASLYYHFSDKSAVLAGVARAVIRQAQPPNFTQDEDWANWMVEMAVGYRRAIVSHPNAASVLVSHSPRQLIAKRYDAGAEILAASGIPRELILLLLDGLEGLATASALTEAASDVPDAAFGFGEFDQEVLPVLLDVLAGSAWNAEELLREQLRSYVVGVFERAGRDSSGLFATIESHPA